MRVRVSMCHYKSTFHFESRETNLATHRETYCLEKRGSQALADRNKR